MAGSTPGPDPIGDRAQYTLRAPKDHLEFYRKRAAALGQPLTRYLSDVLAAAHGLESPDAGGGAEQQSLSLGA